MLRIVGVIATFIIYLSLLKFYTLIKNEPMQKLGFYGVPILHVIYRMLSADRIDEPFRMFVSFFVFGLFLKIFEKNISWLMLFVAFLLTCVLELFAMLIFMITVVILDIENELIFSFVWLSWLSSTFSIVLLLEKYQKISLPTYGKFLEYALIRKMTWALSVLIILLYGFVTISNNLGITFDFITSLVIWGLSITVVLTIMILTIFIIKHLNNERQQQHLLEQENERLNQERLAIEQQMNELKQAQAALQQDFAEMTSHHHAYKYAIPVLMKMQNKLIDEMNRFSDYSHDEKLQKMKDYTDQIRTLTFELDDEFITDHIKTEVTGLNLPTQWLQLSILLESFMQTAKNEGIYLSVYNHATTWEYLEVSTVTLIRLLSNIVDNSIKETCKRPITQRGEIRIIFKNEDTYFLFEVTDHAPEFEIAILEKLGQKKNSTNGTGDGYVEIINALDEVSASFILKEWQNNDEHGKSISIIFDGFKMRLIDSHYRYEKLTIALKETDFEVMDIY